MITVNRGTTEPFTCGYFAVACRRVTEYLEHASRSHLLIACSLSNCLSIYLPVYFSFSLHPLEIAVFIRSRSACRTLHVRPSKSFYTPAMLACNLAALSATRRCQLARNIVLTPRGTINFSCFVRPTPRPGRILVTRCGKPARRRLYFKGRKISWCLRCLYWVEIYSGEISVFRYRREFFICKEKCDAKCNERRTNFRVVFIGPRIYWYTDFYRKLACDKIFNQPSILQYRGNVGNWVVDF